MAASGSEKRYHIDKVVKRFLKWYLKEDDMVPVNGIVYDKYNNGQLKYLRNYQDGLKNGLSQGWYKNGQLSNEAHYKDNKPVGLNQEWYENGQLSYKAGGKDGIRQEWYENGQLKLEEDNYEAGKKVDSKSWYENGNLESEIIGYSTSTSPDKFMETFTGTSKAWHKNKQLKLEDHYKHGIRWSVKRWDEGGTLIKDE